MADKKVVSPGVFTREKDLSFLPAGISAIGASVIGPTVRGPAFVPTTVTSFSEFDRRFGGTTKKSFVPYLAKEYLANADALTVVRVMSSAGYNKTGVSFYLVDDSTTYFVLAGAQTGSGTSALEVTWMSASIIDPIPTASNFLMSLYWSGSDGNSAEETFSASLNPSSANFLGTKFSDNPAGVTGYSFIKSMDTNLWTGSTTGSTVSASTLIVSQSGTQGSYDGGETPWIVSQKISGTATNLFKIHTFADGTETNKLYKAAIENIKKAGSIAGSDYGGFDIVIRSYVNTDNVRESDKTQTIVEAYRNLSMDPEAANYFVKKIGNQYFSYNSSTSKVESTGDFSAASKFIYLEVNQSVLDGAVSDQLIPYGFGAVPQPIGTDGYNIPSASLIFDIDQSATDGTYKYFGFDYATTRNDYYLAPVGSGSINGNNAAFDLEGRTYTGSDGTTITTLGPGSNNTYARFVVPFQKGFDGLSPAAPIWQLKDETNGANTFGFNLSSATTQGTLDYKKAVDVLANPDEIDINMILAPGIVYGFGAGHQFIVNHIKNTCEDRGDCFYIADGFAYTDTVAQSIASGTITGLDSNYMGTYYPWVKIADGDDLIWVTPSVVVPGVFAFNDKVGQEWFAPAGLNRGGLPNVLEARTRLTQTNRDDLYDNKVNPIATFANTGVFVYGQKTLQSKPSALDRISVRRLLINLKKFVASTSKYLVFEPNNTQTRTKFLNSVNPYLESVRQKNGLYAYKVIMDDSINTSEVIDRNQLVGQIKLKPTKTAEFIVLDFIVLATGASFDDA